MFYTYVWLREDGTPYYVGKGVGIRAYRKHRVGNAPPLGRIVFYIAKDEFDAFEMEIALIWYYGRKDLGTGCLRNLTDGGEGGSGYVPTLEERQHRRKLWLGTTRPPRSAEWCEKIRQSKLGKKRDAETMRKLLEGSSRPEAILKRANTIRGRKHSEEHNRRISTAVMGRVPTFETCKKISDTKKSKKLEMSLEQRSQVKHTFFKLGRVPWNKGIRKIK